MSGADDYLTKPFSTGELLARMRAAMRRTTKFGLAPVQRDGLEYEFTLVLDLAMDHSAEASKDNTDMFDGKLFKPTVSTGQALLQWLELGAVPEERPQTEAAQVGGLSATGADPVEPTRQPGMRSGFRRTSGWPSWPRSGPGPSGRTPSKP